MRRFAFLQNPRQFDADLLRFRAQAKAK